ncbi:MAG TPA: GNAT family N-acetyltransferase [Kofleriaceae bacterium]|nr:GNAT family N-acetyltransferase [Kofleriaceae bacterium]
MTPPEPLDLPDLPRWIEAHGIAADPESWRRRLGGGFAVGHAVARLIVVAGAADPASVAALAHELPHHTMLIAIERKDLARATGRRVVRAVLHTLPAPAPADGLDDAFPDLEGAVAPGPVPADDLDGAFLDLEGAVPLPAEVSLAHLPEALAAELERARGQRTVWTAFVDERPVSFAYAPWRSARWFDVSVDTLPEARQLGLGRIVAAAMIRDERVHGRAPVWGADDDNAASLRLARSLGFVAVDALWVAT